MSAARVLLADDHALFVEALAQLLAPKYDVVDIVEDGKALLDSWELHKPDVIVTDITMPIMNGLEAVRRLQKAGCTSKVVFLTMHDEIDFARECLRCGASAFVTKHSGCEELLIALDAVLQNQTYLPRALADLMNDVPSEPSAESSDFDPLTSRQREILQLFAEGRTMKEIAAVMSLSTRTVEWHKYRMMRILRVQTGAELIRHAMRTKLVV
jgi:DNA-binding NarL/FixJ family response regulator